MAAVQIIHVDLAELPDSVVALRHDCLIIFWWKDYPLSQALEHGEPGRSIKVASMAERCVDHATLDRAKQTTDREIAEVCSKTESVSVVICTRDRPDELARCLGSLPEQTRPPSEVVVVDNASREGRTRELAMAAKAIYVREDQPGLDFARNAGIRAASGQIIVYTDDDARLHPRWLERMVAAFDDSRIMAVTGQVMPAELETPAQCHFETFWPLGRGYCQIDYESAFFKTDQTTGCPAWEIGTGASMAFRREIFDQIGFFDERLDVGQAGCSGDSEYWHRVLTHGWVCRYEPSAVVFHYHRRDMAALSNQIFHYMRGHSAALLVQYERSRGLGNLLRVLVILPGYYAKRVVRGLWKGWRESDLFLGQEIRGYISGLEFYLRAPRPVGRPSKLNGLRRPEELSTCD
jgi:glycosyltransferase involved in cell wall biosynthesis